jgi:hypothetical protein
MLTKITKKICGYFSLLYRLLRDYVEVGLAFVEHLIQPAKVEKIHFNQGITSDACCIFHIYASKVPKNTWDYIKVLHQNNIDIILTNTLPVEDETLAELKKYVKIYIQIRNKGQDFAGYKFGFEVFRQHAPTEHVKKLIFCNDSVFVEKERLTHFVAKILNDNSDFSAPVMSDSPIHACSWFLCFSSEVFTASFFQAFWANYIPFSARCWIIQKGEIRLSQTCIKNTYTPQIIYSSNKFIGAFTQKKPMDFYLVSKKVSPHLLKEMTYRKVNVDMDTYQFKEKLLTIIFAYHWHSCNLSLFLNTDFPFIKKDLYSQKVYNVPQISYFFSLDEIKKLNIDDFYFNLLNRPIKAISFLKKFYNFLTIRP